MQDSTADFFASVYDMGGQKLTKRRLKFDDEAWKGIMAGYKQRRIETMKFYEKAKDVKLAIDDLFLIKQGSDGKPQLDEKQMAIVDEYQQKVDAQTAARKADAKLAQARLDRASAGETADLLKAATYRGEGLARNKEVRDELEEGSSWDGDFNTAVTSAERRILENKDLTKKIFQLMRDSGKAGSTFDRKFDTFSWASLQDSGHKGGMNKLLGMASDKSIGHHEQQWQDPRQFKAFRDAVGVLLKQKRKAEQDAIDMVENYAKTDQKGMADFINKQTDMSVLEKLIESLQKNDADNEDLPALTARLAKLKKNEFDSFVEAEAKAMAEAGLFSDQVGAKKERLIRKAAEAQVKAYQAGHLEANTLYFKKAQVTQEAIIADRKRKEKELDQLLADKSRGQYAADTLVPSDVVDVGGGQAMTMVIDEDTGMAIPQFDSMGPTKAALSLDTFDQSGVAQYDKTRADAKKAAGAARKKSMGGKKVRSRKINRLKDLPPDVLRMLANKRTLKRMITGGGEVKDVLEKMLPVSDGVTESLNNAAIPALTGVATAAASAAEALVSTIVMLDHVRDRLEEIKTVYSGILKTVADVRKEGGRLGANKKHSIKAESGSLNIELIVQVNSNQLASALEESNVVTFSTPLSGQDNMSGG